MQSASVCQRIHTDGFECFFLQSQLFMNIFLYGHIDNYCLLVFMLTTENQHLIAVIRRSELQERPKFMK